jgi:hypothetical protein
MSRRPYGDFDGWRGDRGRDGADAEGAYRNDSRYVVSATGSGSSQQSDQEARIKRLEDEVRRLSALLESKEVENNQHHVRIQLFSGGAKGKIKEGSFQIVLRPVHFSISLFGRETAGAPGERGTSDWRFL